MLDAIRKLFFGEKIKIEEEAHRGAQAEVAWTNPVLQRAFIRVKMGVIEKWTKCPVRDTEGQQTLRLMLKLVEDVEANILKEIRDGKVATGKIQIENEKQKKRSKGSQHAEVNDG